MPRSEWKPGQEPFASDLRIMQILMADADHENGNNIIRGRHWKDGKYRVMKIDNEACLRPGSYVRLEHNSAIWGPVTRFNGQTLQRLKQLNFADLKADLGQLMGDHEIHQILSIRDGLVTHINEQVRQRGWGVLFSAAEINFDARLRVGRPASARQLAKFESMLRRKGVKLEYVSGRGLKGALGRTQLRPDGITVKIARAGKRAPRLQTLLEELVHVNQLKSMAGMAGGLAALYASLRTDRRRAKAIKASMEAYAKGKLFRTLDSKRDRRKVKRAQRRFERRAPAQLWRKVPAAASHATRSAVR